MFRTSNVSDPSHPAEQQKLPSIAGTDGSEALMEILRQAQDDKGMPDQFGHDGAISIASAHN